MVTSIADITLKMLQWIDKKADKGFYKSRSELIIEIVKEKMLWEKYPKAMASQRILERVWGDKKDEIWKKYLKSK